MKPEPMRCCALLFAGDDALAPDLTALATARALADQCGGKAQAVIIGPGSARALGLAMHLGLEEIAMPRDHDGELQSQQAVDLLAELLHTCGEPSEATDNVLYLVNADPLHEELGARLAARLGAAHLGRAQSLHLDTADGVTSIRSAYGGRVKSTQRTGPGLAIASVRAGAAGVAMTAARPPTVVHEVATQGALRPTFDVLGCTQAERHAPVDGAKIVVSGGRGIGSPAGFELLYEIALQLGGAVGASLPAVDAGLAPVARQVGQSGKYVRPDIYLAVGISGTPQHMAGIDPHTQVVAINADPDAPIFGVSRIGVVGDWKEVLPALADALNN